MKRLYRSKENRIIGGVCGGIGEYLELDPNIIRLIWLFFVLFGGFGILAYILFWIIMPEKPNKNVKKSEKSSFNFIFGIILIIIGIMMLFGNQLINILPFKAIIYFSLILLGFLIVLKSIKK